MSNPTSIRLFLSALCVGILSQHISPAYAQDSAYSRNCSESLGKASVESGDYERGLEYLHRCPSHPAIEYYRGVAFFKLEQYEDAIEPLGLAAKGYPHRNDIADLYALALLRAQTIGAVTGNSQNTFRNTLNSDDVVKYTETANQEQLEDLFLKLTVLQSGGTANSWEFTSQSEKDRALNKLESLYATGGYHYKRSEGYTGVSLEGLRWTVIDIAYAYSRPIPSSTLSPIEDEHRDIQSSEEYSLEQQQRELEEKQREQQQIVEARQEEERLNNVAEERRRLNMFGSVAYSPSSDMVTLITKEGSEENARASALKSCGQDDCYVAKVFRDCAVAYGTFDGMLDVAEGRTVDEAMNNSEIGFAILAGCTGEEPIAYNRQEPNSNNSDSYDGNYNSQMEEQEQIRQQRDEDHWRWEEEQYNQQQQDYYQQQQQQQDYYQQQQQNYYQQQQQNY